MDITHRAEEVNKYLLHSKAGCEEALLRHRQTLVRLAQRQFRLNDEESRDIVQEAIATWLLYARERNYQISYNSGEHFLCALSQIVIQRSIDRIRKERRLGSLPLAMEMPSPSLDLDALIEASRVFEVEGARVPERIGALRLHYIEGYTEKEVAATFGVKRQAISEWKRSFEKRARTYLKEMIW